MIKYNLKCSKNHTFESWFSDSKEFEKLSRKNLIECIHCKCKKVKKSIMSPQIKNSKPSDLKVDKEMLKEFKEIKNELKKLRSYVEKNFEYVGDKFPSKVRDIHYGKKVNKNIYGVTTTDEQKELAEEGIEITSIPWVKKEN